MGDVVYSYYCSQREFSDEAGGGLWGTDVSSYFVARSYSRSEVESAEVELGSLWTPTTERGEFCAEEWGEWPLSQNLGQPGLQFHTLEFTPDLVQEWHEWWQQLCIRIEQLQQEIARGKERCRLLGIAIGLLLKFLAFPHCSFNIISNNRVWSLLHGSHPPRLSAEGFSSALVDPGRVSYEGAR